MAAGATSLLDWNLSKPAFTEAESVIRAMAFAEHLGARIYIPHRRYGAGVPSI